VSKTYRSRDGDVPSLRPLDFHINEGEFFVVVGPSGCGKSTLLKMISGLLPPSTGEILVEGEQVTKPHGNVGIVFQNALLLPWATCCPTSCCRSTLKRLPRDTYLARAKALLKTGRPRRLREEAAWQLSGGMQQRASICRALVHDPKIMLMRAVRRTRRHDARAHECRTDAHPARDGKDRAADPPIRFRKAVFLADRVLVMTERPGAIAAIYDVPLPRPRSLDAMADPRFTELVQPHPQAFLHAGVAGLTMLRLAVRDIAFFERPVSFARPFRFGAVVIEAAAAIVRAPPRSRLKARGTLSALAPNCWCRNGSTSVRADA